MSASPWQEAERIVWSMAGALVPRREIHDFVGDVMLALCEAVFLGVAGGEPVRSMSAMARVVSRRRARNLLRNLKRRRQSEGGLLESASRSMS